MKFTIKLMNKLVWFLLVSILAVLVGVSWGFYEYQTEHSLTIQEVIDGLFNGAPRQTKSSCPPPIAAPFVPVSKTVTSKPTLPLAVIESVLSDAQKLYEQLRFQEAQVKLAVVADKIHGELAPRYYKLKGKCDIFARLIADMAPGEILPLEGFTEIKLTNGSIVTGFWVTRTEQTIILNVEGDEIPYPRILIADYKKFTCEDRYRQLTQEHQRRLSQLANEAPVLEYVCLSLFCYKHQMNEHALKLLEEALKRDPELLNTVRQDKARGLYEAYQYLAVRNQQERAELLKKRLLKSYPETKYARWIKQGKSINLVRPKVKLKTEEGDKYFEEGRVHLRNTFRRGPDFDTENKAAVEVFHQALACYQEAQILDPEDIEIHKKIREVNQCLVLCRQQTRKAQ
ncbi:hypothetical protein ACFL5I_00325 [Planctomycetota bacterium]